MKTVEKGTRMRTITLPPEVAAELSPLPYVTFDPLDLGDGVVMAEWTYEFPQCVCLVGVYPDNAIIWPREPKVFRPAGEWSYGGRFDYTGWTPRGDRDEWTGDDRHGHPSVQAAIAAAWDRHREVCREFCASIVECAECSVQRYMHHDEEGGSLLACEEFRPGEESGRAAFLARRRQFHARRG